jgi:hypothetical protein
MINSVNDLLVVANRLIQYANRSHSGRGKQNCVKELHLTQMDDFLLIILCPKNLFNFEKKTSSYRMNSF